MTVEQQALFDDDTITLRWQEFNRKHPYVFNEIIKLAERAADRREKYMSMKLCFELVRKTVPRGGNVVALNNDFTAPCARQLIAERPDLAHLFRTRHRKVY